MTEQMTENVLVCRIGDVNPFEHGGGVVFQNGDELELYYTMGHEHEPTNVEEKYKSRSGNTHYRNVPAVYVRWVDLETECPSWIDKETVEKFGDITFNPDDPQELAHFYESAASYYGWDNFDGSGCVYTRFELNHLFQRKG